MNRPDWGKVHSRTPLGTSKFRLLTQVYVDGHVSKEMISTEETRIAHDIQDGLKAVGSFTSTVFSGGKDEVFIHIKKGSIEKPFMITGFYEE